MSLQRLLLLTWLCLLNACGGSSGVLADLTNGGGVGTGGTGIVRGTVTGFGSIVVDGVSYDSASASFKGSTSVTELDSAAPSDVQLGAQVQLTLNAQGQATEVQVMPDVSGVVQAGSVASHGFTLNGLFIRTNTLPQPHYIGISGLSSVRSGMHLAVSGMWGLDAASRPYLQATQILLLPNSDNSARLSGVISALNAASQSFQLDNVTVRYTAGTATMPAGTALKDGMLVNVWSRAPMSNGPMVIQADVIRTRPLTHSSRLTGVVTQLNPQTRRFQIQGITVDASATSLQATWAALTNGQYLSVQGAANAAGTEFTAQQIDTTSSQVGISLQGTVTSVIDARHFQVRGVTVNATTANLTLPTGMTSLSQGTFVTVMGALDESGNMMATQIVATLTPADGKVVEFVGLASQYDAALQTFMLSTQRAGESLNLRATLGTQVSYKNGTLSRLGSSGAGGVTVRVEGKWSSTGTLSVYSIQFIPPKPEAANGTQPVLIQGRIGDLVVNSSVTINGMTLRLSDTSALELGEKVDVWLYPNSQGGEAGHIEHAD